MSWLFSRALVAEYSAANSSDGEPFVPSNGSPTPLAYCAPDKMTAFSRLSRFGTTFKPLTADRGAALLTSYLAASPARTLALQAKAQASTANDPACGHTWPESSVRYDRVSHSWRTHQCLWDEALPESSVTLPKWGMTRDGVVSPLPTLAPRTRESVFGFLLPTPTCMEARLDKMMGGATVYTDRNGLPRRKTANGSASMGLARLVQMWPTPTAHDAKDSGLAPSEGRRKSPCLAYQAGGQLNPTWVEWLMGWPLGWTDLKPLATDKCHSALPKPGESLQAMSEAA